MPDTLTQKQRIEKTYQEVLNTKAKTSTTHSEVIALKQNHFQKYLPSYISGLSLIMSFLLGYLASRWAFRNQQRIENEKKDAQKKSTLEDTHKRIYAELISALYEYLNTSNTNDYNKVHYYYYRSVGAVYHSLGNETEKTKYVELYDKSYQRMLVSHQDVQNVFNKITKLAFEYEYINGKTQVIELMEQITGLINGFTDETIYVDAHKDCILKKEMNMRAFLELRNKQLDFCTETHEESIKPVIEQIKAIMVAETKVS